MTKRAVIITTSILVGLIALFATLFGVVFRVRDIKVVCAEDFCYKAQLNNILTDSKLKRNASIFSVNRNKIADNIEKSYPYARVSGVNITSPTSVKITLTNRTPLYYVVEEAVYYILDEDCKVLNITNDSDEATDYIWLNDVFSVNANTKAGEFLSNKYSNVCTSLYNSIYSNAMLNLGNDLDGDSVSDDQYLDRDQICDIITSVKFTQVDELSGRVDKIHLTTSYGVQITIIEPSKDLDVKINMAFSALRTLIQRAQGEETSGIIAVRYSYDANNNVSLKCEYNA